MVSDFSCAVEASEKQQLGPREAAQVFWVETFLGTVVVLKGV